MSPSTRESLSQESIDSNKALLDLFCVPVVCEVKNGHTFIKRINEQVKLNIFQLLDINDISNPTSIFSFQDHKDMILGYINSLEALFLDDYDAKKLDIVRMNLDKLYNDIEQILDVHMETDDKDHTIDKIETVLRDFLLIIPHHVHANITIETDGSLFQLLIEARNYLDKKFNVQDEIADDADQELENEIKRQKNYNDSIIYLQNSVFSLNSMFINESGTHLDKIDHRVHSLFDYIHKYIGACIQKPQSDQEFKKIHLDMGELFNQFWNQIDDTSSDISKQSLIISYCVAMTSIEEAVADLLKFKNYTQQLSLNSGPLSAKGLFDKLLEYVESNDEENIMNTLNTLQERPDEQLKDLDSDQLNKLLEMLLDREDYIFAAKIRDIIDPKK